MTEKMTEPELRKILADINKRLNQLDRTHPGIGSGGDPEYFDLGGQLNRLEEKLEALIQFLEISHPGLTRTIEKDCKEAESVQSSDEEDTPVTDTLDALLEKKKTQMTY